jgi:hypothetical protein
MCAVAAYEQLQREWEAADAWEAALDRQAELERADLERMPLGKWLEELPELGRPALARALRKVIQREAELRAEFTLMAEADY